MDIPNLTMSALRSGTALLSRKLVTEVVASVIATAVVTVAFSNLKQEREPQPPVLVSAPERDAATGKIVDRAARHGAPELAETGSVRRVADFVKLSGVLGTVSGFPAVPAPLVSTASATPAEPAAQERAAARAKGRPVLVAAAAPVPPTRPSVLVEVVPAAPAPAAEIVPAPVARASLLGLRLPTDMLPSGRGVLTKVSALGGALIERLTP
jgi:hypothetical protein